VNRWLLPLWHTAAAAANLAARLAPDHPHKLVRTLRARRDLGAMIRREAERRDSARPLVWLHAPSVGEGLQARPILEALRRAYPQWQLAYSWFSPSADAFAARLDVDLRAPLPFDARAGMEALLDAWRPTLLAFVKLDVWPQLVAAAGDRGIPAALVSATLAPNSGRQGRLARAVLGEAYAALAAVGAISADDATRLVALGVHPDRVQVTGDTRVDQVHARATSVTAAHPVRALLPEVRRAAACDGPTDSWRPPLLVAGSTWPADEAALLPALTRWLRETPEARCIIAPHEPTPGHLAPIERWAAVQALPIRRLADAERAPEAPWRVLLVDRIGVLGDLYALASIAFVGGGFHAAGLHSVLEPAAFGVPVLFGPRHQNAREAGALLARGAAVRTANTTAIADQLDRWTRDAVSRQAAGAAAARFVEENLGSTARVVALLASLIA
jgi:3-deoxy-D-manno-octulosonic-acid transferase